MDTPSEMRAKIVGKASQDADFRARLLSDPKGAISEELGMTLPGELSVNIHVEDPNTAHVVLPPSSKLSEGDLQAVAGGFFGSSMGQAGSLLNW